MEHGRTLVAVLLVAVGAPATALGVALMFTAVRGPWIDTAGFVIPVLVALALFFGGTGGALVWRGASWLWSGLSRR
jgi:hypothetical protein